ALLCILLSSCGIKSKLKEGEYFPDENYIINNRSQVPTEEIEPFIRQQPNRYLFTIPAINLELFPYHLWLYNSIDQDKMRRKKEERDKKYDQINERRKKKNEIENQKRAAKGKRPKAVKLKDKSEPTWRESWLESGEPPAILDSSLIKGSREQIRR